MSTVHALLVMLQDRGQRSPASIRYLLLELASCCRCQVAKASILVDGLEPLLSLAAEDQEFPRNETLEVLLELLLLLIIDNAKAKADAARGGALELAIRSLRELAIRSLRELATGVGGGRRRVKILKRALELVDLLSHTSESQQPERQKIVLKQVLKMMKNTEEDASVLVRATDTLGRFVDGNMERIQVAAKERAVEILIELIKFNGQKTELKRAVCDVLLVMGEAPGMLQMMAAQNIVSALCICLIMGTPTREVEFSVVRLLLRLAHEARVYGQIIHDEMVPLLFRVVERNSNIREVAATTCTIIADLSDFAQQCKLDLAPFVENCQGKILVLAATCHAQDANVVDCTFRFFVNVSNNPVDLPQLINSETIEGLLSLYVLAGGSGYLAELAGHLVHVISRLSRFTLEQFTIQEEDITLPALFLCLRNYHEDVRFVSQVFAIMAKHWKTQCHKKSVHGITGYVGIAIEVLCRTIPLSKSWGNQTADINNFVREILLSKDGGDVVLSCGGKDLLELLHTHLSAHEDKSPGPVSAHDDDVSDSLSPRLYGACGGEKIAAVVVNMLEKSVLGLTDMTTINTVSPSELATSDQLLPLSNGGTFVRLGDLEYEEYVSHLFHLENSCHFKPIENGVPTTSVAFRESSLTIFPEVPDAGMPKAAIPKDNTEPEEQNLSEEGGGDFTTPAGCGGEDETEVDENEEGDAKNIEDGNNDDSDEYEGELSGDVVELERIPGPGSVSPQERRNSCTIKPTSRITSTSHFFDQLEDRKWYYVDSSQVKYPKHPSRTSQEGKNNPEEEFVLDEPGFLEPCNLPETEVGSRFVEEAVARRAEFVASDVNSRAKIVYENMSMVDDRDEEVAGIPSFLLNSGANQHDAPYFIPEHTKAFPDSATSLTFDSNFESGNLERAIRIGEYEYDLVLRHDFNTPGHMQWFYFAVSNIQTSAASPCGGQKYRFNIINLCKPNSLFNQGLQPVIYSVRDAQLKGKGWLRSGTDIYYFANSFVRPPRNAASFSGIDPSESPPAFTTANTSASAMTYYTLTFTLEFWNTDDTYLIAHSYPYTLTMHQLHTNSILHSGHEILRHSVLCTTLSGRDCDLLTISDFSASQREQNARKAIFITSRVHPGEAQASWMMRGVIDFLLGNSDNACILRRMFVFQIIPILNPDGVYYGNSRCGLSACDLNRQWQTPSKALHPTIFHAKELLFKERSSRGVAFYCDMHGHSRKKNVFVYGCDTKRKPNPSARTFAKLFSMQQIAKKYISFPDCSFKVSRDKETTARVVVANELKINWSFTLEASFCGANYGELYNMHFNTKHLREAGASLCETLFQACITDARFRDKLVSIGDDAKVNIPQLVEPQLREAGAVTEGSSVDENANVNPRSSFLKTKSGSGKKITNEAIPKHIKRKSSKTRAVGTSDTGTSKSTEASNASGGQRRLSRQQKKLSSFASGMLDGVIRNVSIPVFASDDPTNCLDLASIPPPKLSGRKLHGKYQKVRRTKSSSDGYVKSRRRGIPSLASDDAVEEVNPSSQDEANSAPTSNCQTNDSIMPFVSPSRCAGPPTSSVRGTLCITQGPETSYVRSPKSISFPYPCGLQLRDPSVLLPSPVSDIITKSPKAPSNRIRFRGAGRQFSAVSSIPRASIHDILRSDSVTAFHTYEADLIHASTMVIRQRSSISTSNNAAAAADERNLPSSSSNYLSFPSVM